MDEERTKYTYKARGWYRTKDEPPADGQYVLFYRPTPGERVGSFYPHSYFPAQYKSGGYADSPESRWPAYWLPLVLSPGYMPGDELGVQ